MSDNAVWSVRAVLSQAFNTETTKNHGAARSILYQPAERLTHRRHGGRRPAIHDCAARITGKSWMPTCVGMTRLARPWANPFAGWY